MPITLTPDQETFVTEKVAAGQFANATDVLDEALRMLQESDYEDPLPPDELRRELAYGMEALEQGRVQRFDEAGLTAHFEQIKAEGRRRLEQRQQESAS